MMDAIRSLCPEIAQEAIQEFFARMDDDYFETFSAEEISTHIRMCSSLDAKHRVQSLIRRTSGDGGEFDIVIVGFDYLSEFSILCGLLSAFGLDIRAGDIYSFARQASGGRQASGRSQRKIVDVFRVGVKPGEAFGEAEQRDFQQELERLADLLAAGSADQARERLNRALTDRIERMNEQLSGLLSPVEIEFDNQASPDWTLMETHSEDAFAFLYAISNALAMQGVYIHKVKIRSVGTRVKDRFFIADRWGRKIEDRRQQERLRMAVAIIKQFTRFLPEAPDPAKAMRHFDQFIDKLGEMSEGEFPDRIAAFLGSGEGMNMLAHLLGSSDFLWDDFLRVHFTDLLPALEELTNPLDKSSCREELSGRLAQAATFEEKKKVLNRFKDRQLFLIDVHHLLQPEAGLTEFSLALTDLAEVVVDEAAKICSEQLDQPGRPGLSHGTFTICGLGKFGGREMGYASDLELVFVHDAAESIPLYESLVRRLVDFIEARAKGIFHIDLRLRPYGEKGALSTPFEQFRNYYSANGQAAPFERQALIRLRWVAGDETLGRRVEAHRDSYTYSGEPWDQENALHLRRRQIRELVKPGQTNVKYSPGGIIDIEYAVQYLQLLHGHRHQALRAPNTLDALDRLHRLRLVGGDEYVTLRSAYLFLRKLIDGLRIVRGDASDLLLPEPASEEFKSLARRLGYREQDRKKGAARLAADTREWMRKAGALFAARFGKMGT